VARPAWNGSEMITISLSRRQNGPRIEGSGRAAMRNVTLNDFTAVQIEGPFAADITRAESFQVSLTADDNIVGLIEAVKEGPSLRIRLPRGSYHFREKLRASIAMPVLEGTVLTGTARATIQGFDSDRSFRTRISGASKLEGSIRAGDLDFEISGASKLTLRGSARGARISASGASHLELADFTVKSETLLLDLSGASQTQLRGSAKAAVLRAQGASQLALADLTVEGADIVLGGASNATVHVTGLLNYDLSSASSLEYLGDPSIGKSKRTGASRISHRQPGA
jgi:hypothetical protein